jgi:putative ABC transport system ATP-binding protein
MEEIMGIISVEHLKKYYGKVPNQTKAVNDISFSVQKGEFVSIIGSSGSGKSTLLNMIGGLDTPTSGNVYILGKDITSMSEDELTLFRRKNIGFIFQNYNLIPVLSVYENIVLPVELDGRKIDKDFLDDVLDILSLKEKIFNLPNTLSGGQQQRVAIARAIISKPAVILADEPTGNLDSKTSGDVIKLLRTVNQRFEQTLIMITHNLEIAQLSDRIINIIDGKVDI